MTDLPLLETDCAIIGAGPAGLMAAQALQRAGVAVQVWEAKASPARKFLIAGRGGLNLTHSEDLAPFVQRYGAAAQWMAPMLRQFDNAAVRAWAHDLGSTTFVGSSGRVFPQEMKATPLLRAWMQRLQSDAAGPAVRFHWRQRWLGWADDRGHEALMRGPEGDYRLRARCLLLALGGASWPHLGSDGHWTAALAERGVQIWPWQAANCGFDAAGAQGEGWSPKLQAMVGQALKSVSLSWPTASGPWCSRRGEFVLTRTGVEGSLIYAASADLREAINRDGEVSPKLNLLPDWPAEKLLAVLQQERKGQSLSNFLRKRCKLDAAKLALLHEVSYSLGGPALAGQAPAALAQLLQALPLRLLRPRPLPEAISAAGGLCLSELDAQLMLKRLPGVFCAGEMLNWEAPTGGYLLTACMAQGLQAARGMQAWLAQQPPRV